MIEKLALKQLQKKFEAEGFKFACAFIDEKSGEMNFNFFDAVPIIVSKDEHEKQKKAYLDLLNINAENMSEIERLKTEVKKLENLLLENGK